MLRSYARIVYESFLFFQTKNPLIKDYFLILGGFYYYIDIFIIGVPEWTRTTAGPALGGPRSIQTELRGHIYTT